MIVSTKDPAEMTPAECRQELAAILGAAIMRLHRRGLLAGKSTSDNSAESGRPPLDVHAKISLTGPTG